MNLPAHIITCQSPSMNLPAHGTTSPDPSKTSLSVKTTHTTHNLPRKRLVNLTLTLDFLANLLTDYSTYNSHSKLPITPTMHQFLPTLYQYLTLTVLPTIVYNHDLSKFYSLPFFSPSFKHSKPDLPPSSPSGKQHAAGRYISFLQNRRLSIPMTRSVHFQFPCLLISVTKVQPYLHHVLVIYSQFDS
ncbi:hypothetical protein DEO72_LG10g1865 [Vigna unguiculata]|uniref:Uncharacterized protein n=1 Tax=Vigna unguiculata TaxID=3917 RepID=A0A4D6ND11_VIGUN|nr:hypothetical protein DEO72_LG10g1865 [Vigna unguiculata]